jgi:hypothetical protein
MNTLDSVVDALARDPARKFVVVEQVSTVSQASFLSCSPILVVCKFFCCIAADPLFSRLDLSSSLWFALQTKSLLGYCCWPATATRKKKRVGVQAKNTLVRHYFIMSNLEVRGMENAP